MRGLGAVAGHARRAARRGRRPARAASARISRAKAKRVIFLFMTGGVSHVDSFDPKPALAESGGGRQNRRQERPFMGSPWGSKRYGKSGIEVSDLFPHIGGVVDDLCVIRSMTGDHNDHFQATLGIHTGSVTVTRPSIGSWVSYGLGTENHNLPSFVVLAPHCRTRARRSGRPTSCPAPPGHARHRRAPSRSPT